MARRSYSLANVPARSTDLWRYIGSESSSSIPIQENNNLEFLRMIYLYRLALTYRLLHRLTYQRCTPESVHLFYIEHISSVNILHLILVVFAFESEPAGLVLTHGHNLGFVECCGVRIQRKNLLALE